MLLSWRDAQPATSCQAPRRSTRRARVCYAPHIRALQARRASGIYAIFDAGNRAPLYVGESHTGRLFDTITRHFRSWRIDPRNDAQGRRRGGTTYTRERVRVAVLETEPDTAQALQYRAIAELRPRDNDIQGHSATTIRDQAGRAELDAMTTREAAPF